MQVLNFIIFKCLSISYRFRDMAHWKRYDFYAGKNGKNGHFRPFSPINQPYKNRHTDQTDWCTQNVNTSMERGDHCRHFGINFIIVSSLIRSQRSFEFVSIFTDESRFQTSKTACTIQVIHMLCTYDTSVMYMLCTYDTYVMCKFCSYIYVLVIYMLCICDVHVLLRLYTGHHNLNYSSTFSTWTVHLIVYVHVLKWWWMYHVQFWSLSKSNRYALFR